MMLIHHLVTDISPQRAMNRGMHLRADHEVAPPLLLE